MGQIPPIALIIQCTATLFLFLVFRALYRYSGLRYLAYWTVGWLALGTGLLALLLNVMDPASGAATPNAIYQASEGAAALFALFATYAFLRERAVPGPAWLLLVPVCGGILLAALRLPQPHALSALPRHALFALALWASASVFWRIARREGRPGARYLAWGFALWGLLQAHHGVLPLVLELGPTYLGWMRLLDTAIVLHVALSMIVFALDQERSHLLEANHKLEVSEQRLKELAMRDPLTGLFNRHHFDHAAPQIEAQARRLGIPLAVFVVDLNNFKETNDRDGHLRGDQILRAFAEFLRRETRAADVPFRWGGDEFLILMLDLSWNSAEIKGQQLQERWDRVRRELETDVTVAVGWAFLDEEGLEGAIRRADSRMYGDKRATRGAPDGAGPEAPSPGGEALLPPPGLARPA